VRRALLPVLAVTGVVIGHTLTYSVAWPDGSLRASLLQDTGHAYWRAAVAAALLAGAFAAGSHATLAFRRLGPQTLPRVGAQLAALQIAIFTMMEASERVAIDQPLTTLFDHHVLVIGVVVQTLVAIVLVQVLRLVGRVAIAVAEAHGASRWTPAATPVIRVFWATPVVLRGAAIGGPCGSRAPPLAA
jgi:hypothetical protein